MIKIYHANNGWRCFASESNAAAGIQRHNLQMPNHKCLTLATVVASIWIGASAGAQDMKNHPPPQVAGFERVSSKLIEMARLVPLRQRAAMTKPIREALRQRAKVASIKLRDDDKIFVQIIAPEEGNIAHDLDLPALKALGLEIGVPFKPLGDKQDAAYHVPLTRTEKRAEAWLPVSLVEQMAQLLPPGYLIRPSPLSQPDEVVGEGPVVTNSGTYASADGNGSGLTIAVIDYSFAGLTAARNNGDAPVATQINLSGDATFDGPDPATDLNTHGTKCVESAFDHAPGAVWRIYRIDSPEDITAVVTDCIANNVNIISHSLSSYNEGWGDDAGITCQQATRAAQAGILFFTSAGNRADSHYQGQFADTDNDGWMEFANGDESIDVMIGMSQGGGHYLSWSNADTDLDFYLYNSTGNTIIMSSATAGAGRFEEFGFTNAGAAATFRLMVFRRSGSANTAIELFSHNSASWTEHIVAVGSTTSPSNATHPGVISVGAVTQGSYGNAAGTNVIASYSSRGPSNGGMTIPDLCGPTNTTCFTVPGSFGGTSCATPNAAGAACSFWSANINLTAEAARWLIFEQAKAYRDWGIAGVENTYGAGGLRFVDHTVGTLWLARNYPGTLDDGSVPFHTVAAANVWVPNNGRLLFFGSDYGTFPETISISQSNKNFTMEVLPNTSSARLGP